MHAFPLPGSRRATVAVAAPGGGPGFWAGSSSAALDEDGTFVLAYRAREGVGPDGGASVVVARSADGEAYTTVATLDKSRFGAQSLERPALVRTDEGRWRLYVCPASQPPSKHWWIDVLEADEPPGFATGFQHVRCGERAPFRVRRPGCGSSRAPTPISPPSSSTCGRSCRAVAQASSCTADQGPTQGCVSIGRRALVRVLRWLDPSAAPRIAIRVGQVG